MTWNYRVMRHGTREDGYLAIHEAYYDDNGEIDGWTISEISPSGTTLKELKRCMKLYRQALKRPILDYTTEEGVSDEQG